MGFLKSKLSSLKRNHFLKNVAVLSGGTVIAQILPVLFTPLLGRLYDAQALGVYTIYISIINITQQIACFRYDYAIVVADDDDEAGGAFLLSCLLAVGFSLLMAVIMWPFIPQIGGMMNLNTPAEQASLWAVPLTTLICGTTTAITYFNVRHERYKTISSGTIIKAIASIAIQIGLYYLFVAIGWKDFVFWGMILGQLFSNFFGNMRMFMTLKGRIHRYMFRGRFLLDIAKKNAHYPKYMLPSGLANSLTMNITPLTISMAYSVSDTGLYGMVNRVLGLPLTMISNSVSQVFLKQASVDKENKNNLDKTFANVAKWLAIIGIVPFGILFLFGDPILPFFLGADWKGTATLLKLVIPLFAVRFVVTPLTSSAIALGKQKATLLWQCCLLGTVLLPSIVAVAWDGLSFHWYLLISSLMMAGAYLVFYRFCQNIVRNAGKQPAAGETEARSTEEQRESIPEDSGEIPQDMIVNEEKGADAMDTPQHQKTPKPKKKPGEKRNVRVIWKSLTANRPFMIILGLFVVALIIIGISVGSNIKRASILAAVDYSDATPVTFQSKDLEKYVCDALGKKPGSTLYDRDLEELTKLTILGAGEFEVKSLDDLKYCVNLETLQLTDVGLVDISAVANMPALRTLDLSTNKINDISALANCPALTFVNLASNQIQDVSALYDLIFIEELDLSINQIGDYDPLLNIGISSGIQNLQKMNKLNLSNNKISDISIFSNMPNLKILYLGSNDITDVVPLENMKKLEEYNLQRNTISSITSLGEMPELNCLTLSNNRLADLSFLKNYPWVGYLSIDGNLRISTLQPLSESTGLQAINIKGTQVKDLSPLENLSKNYAFCAIYLDDGFDRSKIDFMIENGKFRTGDEITREYVISKKYNESESSGE